MKREIAHSKHILQAPSLLSPPELPPPIPPVPLSPPNVRTTAWTKSSSDHSTPHHLSAPASLARADPRFAPSAGTYGYLSPEAPYYPADARTTTFWNVPHPNTMPVAPPLTSTASSAQTRIPTGMFLPGPPTSASTVTRIIRHTHVQHNHFSPYSHARAVQNRTIPSRPTGPYVPEQTVNMDLAPASIEAASLDPPVIDTGTTWVRDILRLIQSNRCSCTLIPQLHRPSASGSLGSYPSPSSPHIPHHAGHQQYRNSLSNELQGQNTPISFPPVHYTSVEPSPSYVYALFAPSNQRPDRMAGSSGSYKRS